MLESLAACFAESMNVANGDTFMIILNAFVMVCGAIIGFGIVGTLVYSFSWGGGIWDPDSLFIKIGSSMVILGFLAMLLAGAIMIIYLLVRSCWVCLGG